MPARRRLAVGVHLWGGLLTGPLLLVLGLSGAALVFRPEVEDALNAVPALARAEGTAAPSLDGVLGAALIRYPAAELRALRLPAQPEQPYRVELASGRQRLDVAVDPHTLQVIGSRAQDRSVFVAVRSLHAFDAGRAGALLVGLLGLWLVVEGVTGLWLCWPSTRRRPQLLGPPTRERRLHYALHSLVGWLSLALGMVVALTGTALALASVLGLGSSRDAEPGLAARASARLDMIAERAEKAMPGGPIRAVIPESGGAVRVEKLAGTVIVDRDAGRVVAVRTEPQRAGGWDVVRRLHYGDFAGWASRLLYALVGLALPLLAITGYLISARRAG